MEIMNFTIEHIPKICIPKDNFDEVIRQGSEALCKTYTIPKIYFLILAVMSFWLLTVSIVYYFRREQEILEYLYKVIIWFAPTIILLMIYILLYL